MLVERVEKTVTKTPEEEQNGDQANGIDGLAESQLGCSRPATVVGLERAPLDEFLEGHNVRSASSLTDGEVATAFRESR